MEVFEFESSILSNLKLSITSVLKSNNLMFNGNKVNSLEIYTEYTPELLKFPKITIDSDKINLKAKLSLDLRQDTPRLEINSYSDNFDWGFFVLPNSNLKKDSNVKTDISSKRFNFYGMNKVRATLDLSFKKLVYNNYVFNSLKFRSFINNRALTVEDFFGYFYNSRFAINGGLNMGLTPGFSLSFASSSLDLENLAKALNKDAVTAKAKIFVSGGLGSSGETPEIWLKALKGNVKLTGKDFTVEGFNISTVIKESPDLYSVIDMKRIIDESFDKGRLGITYFKGEMEIENEVLKAKNFRMLTPISKGNFASNISLRNFNSKSRAIFFFEPAPDTKVNILIDMQGDFFKPEKTINSKSLERFIIERVN